MPLSRKQRKEKNLAIKEKNKRKNKSFIEIHADIKVQESIVPVSEKEIFEEITIKENNLINDVIIDSSLTSRQKKALWLLHDKELRRNVERTILEKVRLKPKTFIQAEKWEQQYKIDTLYKKRTLPSFINKTIFLLPNCPPAFQKKINKDFTLTTKNR